MANELIQLGESQQTMSSLEIAELTGKDHKHVLRDIRNLLEQGVAATNFGQGVYKDKNNQDRPCFHVTKKGCLILASGYNALLREKIINRWEALETGTATPAFKLPQSYAEALRELAGKVEENERLMLENKQQTETIHQQNIQIAAMSEEIVEMKQKTDYLEIILSSVGSVTTTQIAQDYGMSAVAFNKQLEAMRIQRKVNGQWILYAPYISEGYIKSKTIDIVRSDGRPDTVMHTEWRQKGRLFLYNKLKEIGILPLIERTVCAQVQNNQETCEQQE